MKRGNETDFDVSVKLLCWLEPRFTNYTSQFYSLIYYQEWSRNDMQESDNVGNTYFLQLLKWWDSAHFLRYLRLS